MVVRNLPGLGPAASPIPPPELGQAASRPSGAVTVGAEVLGLGLSGAAAWVGIHTGLHGSGLLSAASWVVGIIGLARLADISGIFGAATPPARPERAV